MPQQYSLFDLFEAPPPPPDNRARVVVAPGPRAAEGVLWEVLDPLLAAAEKDPMLLASPVRVVVPSRSLRLHLSARLVARRGRPAAGVVVQTLHRAALEALERCDETSPAGAPVFDVLARRFARGEPALARPLDGLVDGYAGVAGTVRDLLDAGFEPELVEPVLETLVTAARAGAATAGAAERAGALVRVAARVEAAARQLGLGRSSHLLRRAAELVAADPERALPARAVVVHGFADATGLATDLIQALLRRPGACLVLDRPPDPARPGQRQVEQAFTERLARRLELVARIESPAAAGERLGPPRLVRRTALGAEGEARAAAAAVRGLLDGGARPEGIGLVARDLEPYRFPLRRHLALLGVPFSGLAARAGLGPDGRRARALLELLRLGPDTPCDRWLDAALSLPAPAGAEGLSGPDDPNGTGPDDPNGPAPDDGRLEIAREPRRRADLRLALRALGAGRLRDLLDLDLAAVLFEGSYALPVRLGLRAGASDAVVEEAEREEADGAERGEAEGRGGGGVFAPRRSIPGEQLELARAAARTMAERFAGWPDQAPAGRHLDRLVALLTDDLGWRRERSETAGALAALEALAREVPAEIPLARDEVRQLAARALDPTAGAPLGGSGAGVQVLSVIEARARTFEHLFVLGLNRDVFPRTVREDPLFPDTLRLALAGPAGDGVLPDLPVKRTGFDEERYLFAQLLAAAPAVTLSWQTLDDDGRAASPSPLIERLPAPDEAAPEPAPLPALPVEELAVRAALCGDRRRFAEVLAVALPARTPESADPATLAAVRAAVLDEMDPDLRTPEGRAIRRRLGPYFGFIGGFVGGLGGGLFEGDDPRAREVYVTLLENLAACPWQTFLTRLLRLEPTPDPLQALPGLGALLLGNVVHAVLQRIVREALPGPVPWPPEPVLEQILAKECIRAVRAEGIAQPGLARALAARARPFLEVARANDWDAGLLVAAQAVESEGRLEVDAAGTTRRLAFKADRVDAGLGGRVLTDYKTGRPPSAAVTAVTRRRHFLERVRTGRLLQAAAYALAPEGGHGRYLYLRPDEVAERDIGVGAADGEVAAAFATAVAAAFAAWEAGTFAPRLVDASGRKEPARCSFCEVAEACLRRDSGARLRIAGWAAQAPGTTEEGEAGEALRALWWLGQRRPGEGEGP